MRGLYRRGMRYVIVTTALLVLAACQQKAGHTPSQNETAASPGESEMKGAHRDSKGKAAPDSAFTADGTTVRISDFKGKPVLVNLWASWCAPCVKELPTLDQLARGGNLQVLAVSQDSGPHASVVAFLEAHHISKLKPYQDSKMSLSAALGPETVLPTSILIDANGKEVWRYVGDLDWTSPQAAKLLGEAGGAQK